MCQPPIDNRISIQCIYIYCCLIKFKLPLSVTIYLQYNSPHIPVHATTTIKNFPVLCMQRPAAEQLFFGFSPHFIRVSIHFFYSTQNKCNRRLISARSFRQQKQGHRVYLFIYSRNVKYRAFVCKIFLCTLPAHPCKTVYQIYSCIALNSRDACRVYSNNITIIMIFRDKLRVVSFVDKKGELAIITEGRAGRQAVDFTIVNKLNVSSCLSVWLSKQFP